MNSREEIEFIKKYQALPKTIIQKRLSELVDEMLSSEAGEDFNVKRLFAVELRRWLKTIRIFTDAELTKKPESFT